MVIKKADSLNPLIYIVYQFLRFKSNKMRLFVKKEKDIVKPNEFRYNKARGGHPAYIVEVIYMPKIPPEKKARFIGLTESPKTQGIDNIILEVNPNPAKRKLKDEKAYARPNIDEVVLTKKTFGKKLEDWEFDVIDKPKIEIIIANDSKKRKK